MAKADNPTSREVKRVMHDFKEGTPKNARASAAPRELPPLADSDQSGAGEEDPGAALDMVGGGELATAPASVRAGGVGT